MNQSLDGFVPAVYALLYQVFTLFSAVYALLYQEFTCFSVKNRSVKVILSSDEFTTAIYMLSVVEKSFLCSQSLNQSIEVESAIEPLSVTIYAPSVVKQRHTNMNWSDLYDQSMASACSVIKQAHRSNLSSICALHYRM